MIPTRSAGPIPMSSRTSSPTPWNTSPPRRALCLPEPCKSRPATRITPENTVTFPKTRPMVPALRTAFNSSFTRQRYDNFMADLNSRHPGAIEFRLADTPVFIPADFAAKLTDISEHLVDLIAEPRFSEWTERAIPAGDRVPNENDHPHFLAFDFGVCDDEGQEMGMVIFVRD